MGCIWAMLKMKLQGKAIKFKQNEHISVEGNFVLSVTEGFVGDKKTFFVFYDGRK